MISKAITIMRQYHNLKQNELASKLCITKSYLSLIESGKRKPNLKILEKYAELFKVPLSCLVMFSETLEGKHTEGKVKAFLSKKMLKILEWSNERSHL